MRLLLLYFFSISCLLFSATSLKAEGEEEALERLKEAKEVLIDSKNIKQFRSLLLPELLPYIMDGGDVLSAKSSFNIPPIPLPKENAILESAELSNPSRIELPKALPFAVQTDTKTAEFPVQLLWNAQALMWKNPVWFGDYSMQRVKNSKSDQIVRGVWKRVYPATLPEPPKIPQLFRERIEVLDPKSLNHYSWLTFRFFGREEEDYVMIYSPIINQSRQLTGSNRSDPFLPGLFSVDDLFGWSGKIEWVDPTFQGETTMLLPYIDEKSVSFKERGSCNSATLLSRQVADRMQFIPSIFTWTPRKVWEIELTQREPFASYGRTVLYIDTELLLPVLRVVYDRGGKFLKVTILTSVVQNNEKNPQIFPISLTMLSADGQLSEQLMFEELSQCSEFPEGMSLGEFDPRKLGVAKTEKEKAKPVVLTTTPTPAEALTPTDNDSTSEVQGALR